MDPRDTLREGITSPRIPRRWTVDSTLSAARAYLDLLKGLCLLQWDELGKPNGTMLVGILREKWEEELKAARGSASASMRKAVAQGAELANLQAAHMRLRKNLTKVQAERDELKLLLHMTAPTAHDAWLEEKRRLAALDDPNRLRAADCKSVGVTPHGGSTPPQRTIATDIPQRHETHGD